MNLNNLSARLKWYFGSIVRISVSFPATQVTNENQRDWIRRAFQFLRENSSGANIEEPDFDFDKWKPKPVDNFYISLVKRIKRSKLLILLFLASEGSAGQGIEATIAEQNGIMMLAFALHGVKISPVMLDCLQKAGVKVVTIASYNEMYKHIYAALQEIKAKQWLRHPLYCMKSLRYNRAVVSPSH